MPDILKDSFGRIHNNLRISVTDRCNFRCRYCMPEQGLVWLDKSELLTFEEIVRLVRIFAELGVTKVRLTGGEPLLRRDLYLLVEKIARVSGIQDIAMTTNGFSLAQHALPLVKAGLKRITVSVDSLDPQKFSLMARGDYLRQVWEGLDAAEQLPIRPIKINVVLIRGINDDEIEAFAKLARVKPFVVRFIEFMPIGADDGWSPEKVVPTREVIRRINDMGPKLLPIEYHGAQPADRYMFEDGLGEVGFITSVTEPFCANCHRVRITPDGKLRTCLFALEETDLRFMLRGGAGDDDIAGAIVNSVRNKQEGHLINRPGFVRPERTMSQIGG